MFCNMFLRRRDGLPLSLVETKAARPGLFIELLLAGHFVPG